jgi:SAM-dependent methyltransferase
MTNIEGLIEEGEAFRITNAKRSADGAWASARGAEAWRRQSALRNTAFVATTERMLARAAVRPGMNVLVLGAGTGDDAAFVADEVGCFGRVLATDLSREMVRACAETMQTLGLSWVESRVMDVAEPDVAPDSFDAVVSRHGLMFTPHLQRALEGARAALRPGGRFATTSWGPLDVGTARSQPVEASRDRPRALDGPPARAARGARPRSLALQRDRARHRARARGFP